MILPPRLFDPVLSRLLWVTYASRDRIANRFGSDSLFEVSLWRKITLLYLAQLLALCHQLKCLQFYFIPFRHMFQSNRSNFVDMNKNCFC